SDEVRRSGSCTGSATVKIKAKHDDGRIELEAEVDSNRAGQRWRWVFRHNGYVSFTGRAITRAPSGSFEVERRAVNARGIDAFKFRAKHRASGQVCAVRVKLCRRGARGVILSPPWGGAGGTWSRTRSSSSWPPGS